MQEPSIFESDLSVETRSAELKGKHLAFCVSGGIGAIEAPRTIRELRRRGATIQVWATEKVFQFIGRTSLEWASGRAVLEEPSGLAQHVATGFDGVVVFPATAQMIAMIAQGLCADGMSTFLQSALGMRLPMVIFPAMHDSLFASPAVLTNMETISLLPNVHIATGAHDEGKRKVPKPETAALIAAHALNRLGRSMDKKPGGTAYVTGGGTRSSWDPVRCLTNISTGRLSRALCLSLYARGAKVVFLKAQCQFEMESLENLKVIDCPEFEDLESSLKSIQLDSKDGFFHLAAVSDYLVSEPLGQKISSQIEMQTIQLKQAPKLILTPSGLQTCAFRFAGKLTTGSKTEGLKIAQDFLAKSGFSACLWNRDSALSGEEKSHEGTLLKSVSWNQKNPTQIENETLLGKNMIAERVAEMYLAAVADLDTDKDPKS